MVPLERLKRFHTLASFSTLDMKDQHSQAPFGSVENIMLTSPCNEQPLTPHFIIVKLGFTGVDFFSY